MYPLVYTPNGSALFEWFGKASNDTAEVSHLLYQGPLVAPCLLSQPILLYITQVFSDQSGFLSLLGCWTSRLIGKPWRRPGKTAKEKEVAP